MSAAGKKSFLQYGAFGLGHVLNDAVSCLWFSFFLIYLTHVLLISDFQAGILIFIGQITDAVSTPIAGMLSDARTRKHGPKGRKLWLGIGCIVVAVTCPLLFGACAPCTQWEDAAKFGFLAIVVILLQSGWAMSQVSHLALLTDIGTTGHVYTLLNSIRFGATVCSNLLAFLTASIILSSGGQHHLRGCYQRDDTAPQDTVTPQDAPQFRLIALTVSCLGLMCGMGCILGVKVPSAPVLLPAETHRPHAALWRLLHRRDLWEVGALYTSARLMTNVAQVYLQLFVLEALHLPALALALVPSTVFAGQMGAAAAMPFVRLHWSSNTLFVAALMSVWAGSVCAFAAYWWMVQFVYLAGVALGLGCGAAMILSLALLSDLASSQKHASAGVYALTSFADKVANGAVLLLLQHGLESRGSFQEASPARTQFVVGIITLIPTAAAFLAFLVLGSVTHSSRSEEVETDDGEVQPLLTHHAP